METPKASGARWRGAVVDDLQLPAAFALPSSECAHQSMGADVADAALAMTGLLAEL